MLICCKVINSDVKSTKVASDLKSEAQNISCASQSIIEEEAKAEIIDMFNFISVFDQVTPEDIAKKQQKDLILKIVCQHVTVGE